MIAAHTGKADTVNVLLEYGANINAQESWDGTNVLMWAINENMLEVLQLLLANGADVNQVSLFVAPDTGRGFEGSPLRARQPEEIGPVQCATGEFTPLIFAVREGLLDAAKMLVSAGA